MASATARTARTALCGESLILAARASAHRLIAQAYLYITRAFKDYTPHVMGSLKLLAASYPPDELNKLGMHMYVSAWSVCW